MGHADLGVGAAREGGTELSHGRLEGSHEQQSCGAPSSTDCTFQADFILSTANIY